MKSFFPENYKSILSIYDTQKAISILKRLFEDRLGASLNLYRVSAPLFVDSTSGLNDNLSGVERPVSFDILRSTHTAEVVQSLAKWKRMALYRYGYQPGEGIYTDMNAIRRDDDTDNTHSIFVDQWDWEKVITREQRNVEFLKETVKAIVKAVAYTKRKVSLRYPQLKGEVCETPYFITTQELENMYPDKTSKERERLITKEHKTVFIMQIGGRLASGEKHDGRAPDYDDWSLNGDILFYSDVLDDSFEISSMGIRVDAESLDRQLEESGKNERRVFDYHKKILNNELPLTIGGGIGQSRTCMLLLGKEHIGEVQASLWPDEMKKKCAEKGVNLL